MWIPLSKFDEVTINTLKPTALVALRQDMCSNPIGHFWTPTLSK